MPSVLMLLFKKKTTSVKVEEYKLYMKPVQNVIRLGGVNAGRTDKAGFKTNKILNFKDAL